MRNSVIAKKRATLPHLNLQSNDLANSDLIILTLTMTTLEDWLNSESFFLQLRVLSINPMKLPALSVPHYTPDMQ